LVLADRRDGQRAHVEHHAIIDDLEREALGKDLADPVLARVANSEQVDVARGAMRMAGPQREQRRAL
jgi:hypothetical protein